jgi:predicted DNA-binding protein (UPF0251 family)
MNPAPSDSWRSWLVTGNRGVADKRRARGAHRGLKKILIEGMGNGGDRGGHGGQAGQPWKDFSGAMVRQAVNEALNQLPPEHTQVVKLAYFGGMSNREIAERLGISVGVVQRRLRWALGRISDHVEHGRRAGKHAIYCILAWLAARQVAGAEHVAAALAVAAVTTTMAVQPGPVAAPTPRAAQQVVALKATALAPALRDHSSPPVSAPAAPAVRLPSKLPVSAPALPALPSLPALPTPPVKLPKV